MFRKVILILFISIFYVQVSAEEDCSACDRSKCEVMPFCPAGVAPDPCGCCEVCAQRLGQKCNYIPEDESEPIKSSFNGTCGEFLVCSEEGVCECEEEGEVCGTDDVTYDSLCLLMEATSENMELTLSDRAPCSKGPVIKSHPKDAARPAGSILVLDCEASGFPVPAISWELYRPDGSTVLLPNDNSLVAVQVRGGPEKHMATGWVQIMKVMPENTGIYTCIATNSKGQVKSSATVSLKKGHVAKKN